MASTIPSRTSWPLKQLPGLDPQDSERLQHCGLTTTSQLLAATGTQAQKQQLLAQLQIHAKHLNKWVALAQLAQVPSVGVQHCGLLLHAGVSSCAQLAQMPAAQLHQNILRLHVALLRKRERCPSVAEVNQWVQQARQLQR
ncbi:MAG: DUF4332 domain-containing protein [Thermosynechococcaceae cyanobacterium]